MLDPDGNDIVYFNMDGEEVRRTVSNKEFKTFVGYGTGNYSEAPMPKIIKSYEDAKYQKYDYNIAAQTFILTIYPVVNVLQLQGEIPIQEICHQI